MAGVVFFRVIEILVSRHSSEYDVSTRHTLNIFTTKPWSALALNMDTEADNTIPDL